MNEVAAEAIDDDLPAELRPRPRGPLWLAFKFLIAILLICAIGIALRPLVPRIMNYGQPVQAEKDVPEASGSWAQNQPAPEWFTAVADVDGKNPGRIERTPRGRIKSIVIPNASAVSDNWLSNLNHLRDLEVVELHNARIYSGGISYWGSRNVVKLVLDGSQLTGSELFNWIPWPRIEHLSLNRCPVDDGGLKNIGDALSLRVLHLANTRITDAGLIHLTKLQKLKSLDLTGTKVTDEGVKKLQIAIPNCQISH